MSPRIRASLIYGLFFGAEGCLIPFLNLYYQQYGLSRQEIGVLIAAMTLTRLISSPAWSAAADAFRLHRFMLPLSVIAVLIPVAAFASATQFAHFFLAVFAYAIFVGPALPLLDSAVLDILGDEQSFYGKLRLWGAVGWAVSSLSVGLLAEQVGLGVIFVFYVILMGLCGLLVLRLPTPQVSSNDSYLRNMRLLFVNPAWLGFLLSIFLVAVCNTFINNFLPLYLDDLGASEALYGLGVSMSGLSELPIFFFSALLIQWLRPAGLLRLAFLVWALRAFLVSVMPTPETIVLTQLLHGLSFSALWTGAVIYAARLAPSGLGTTAQSVMGMTQWGIAGSLGGWIGANLYDLIGPQNLFRLGTLLALSGFFLFLVVELRARRRHAQVVEPR